MKALDTIRGNWRQLKNGKPGQRFRDFHEARRKRREDGFSLERVLVLSGGFLLLVGGLAIGWLPGPGGFVSIFGAALLATEFRPLARLLDWAEVRTRRAAKWLRLHWQRSPLALKIVSVIAIALVVAGAAYATVSIIF
jgi:uncharacterized protein (TIGR02611 family)